MNAYSIIKNYVFNVAVIAIILLNLFAWRNTWLGLIVGFLYLFVYGRKLGRILFAKFDKTFQTLFGILSYLGAIAILFSLGYYFYKINDVLFVAVLIIGAVAIELLQHFKQYHSLGHGTDKNPGHTSSNTFNSPTIIMVVAYLLTVAGCFFLLIHARTDQSLASPWQVVSKTFFPLFTLASALLVATIIANGKTKLSLALVCLHTFLMAGVASIVYAIGYGYDPFLHLAGQKIIIATGTLLPKIFYYIGEYSIAIFINKLTFIPLDWINKFLVQIMFAIYLPASIYYGFVIGKQTGNRRALLLPLIFTILPLTYFISTTPQSLAAVFCLAVIFLSQTNKPMNYIMSLLAIAMCFVHPLLGLPILFYVLYLLINQSNIKALAKKISKTIIIAVSAFIYPILFYGYALATGNRLGLKLSTSINWPAGAGRPHLVGKQYNFIYDLFYVYGANWRWIFALIVIVALVALYYKKQIRQFSPQITFAVIMLFNYALITFAINFPFLTGGQAIDYQNRILDLAFYFFLPAVLFVAYQFFNKLFSLTIVHKTFAVFLICLVVSVSLYFSYPVKDNYGNSKNFGVGQADIDAVHFINNNATAEYIVLANQIVAAAAINEHGFKKYYNGAFYYSIPDGQNNFNDYFLKMLASPSRENANNAMKKAGVKELYFVVNKYWTNAPKIIERAKTTADSWQEFGSGADYVFHY